jgi:hypothetical protein
MKASPPAATIAPVRVRIRKFTTSSDWKTCSS